MKNPFRPYENMQRHPYHPGHPHHPGPRSNPQNADMPDPETATPEEMAGPETPEQEPAAPEQPDLVSQCKENVCPTCPERAEMEEQRLRQLADLDNTRKRLIREKEEAVKFAAEKVLADLLPTLDNLDLALSYGQNNPECKDLIVGVEMTKKLLLDTLAKHGLVPVGKEGEEFNPEFHEAMSQEERSDMNPNHIARLFQKGYLLKDRLLRPAKVVVSKSASAS